MVKAKEPVAEEWYPVKLGSTCHDDATTRYYSLRYEFKPASIDNMRPGSLHNSAENKVTVEFFNNQAGKPKVAFQGNSEDCKELDAVLFFDGQSFRLERMHRAVKSLRHIRQPGESSAAANAALKETEPESPRENGNVERISTSQVAEKSLKKPPASTPIQIREKIESEEILPAPAKVDPPAGKKKGNKKGATEAKSSKNKKAASPALPAALLSSPPTERKREREPSPLNIDIDDEGEDASPAKKAAVEEEQIEVEELVEELSEYEEVDISDDDEGEKTGVDQTAAALRAQAAENMETKASSSSSSSGSGSSESGSGSSSSDSGSDEEDSASSADDGDDI